MINTKYISQPWPSVQTQSICERKGGDNFFEMIYVEGGKCMT